MASNRQYHNKSRPWIARRHRNGIEYFLGYYTTRKEAEEVESKFDEQWPRPTNKGLRREIGAGGKFYFA